MSDAIDRLKSEPPLLPSGCGTCFHLANRHSDPYYWKCGAFAGHYTSHAWPHCKGNRWEPRPPPVPVLVRLKRWLIG